MSYDLSDQLKEAIEYTLHMYKSRLLSALYNANKPSNNPLQERTTLLKALENVKPYLPSGAYEEAIESIKIKTSTRAQIKAQMKDTVVEELKRFKCSDTFIKRELSEIDKYIKPFMKD